MTIVSDIERRGVPRPSEGLRVAVYGVIAKAKAGNLGFNIPRVSATAHVEIALRIFMFPYSTPTP